MGTIDTRAADAAHCVGTDYELQRDCEAETTAALYAWEAGRPHCPVCLRHFIPSPREGRGGRGGPVQVFCCATCRSRYGDATRRDTTREWRICCACGGPFVALAANQVTCPAPWPASPHDRDPDCAAQHRRDRDRMAHKRARALARDRAWPLE